MRGHLLKPTVEKLIKMAMFINAPVYVIQRVMVYKPDPQENCHFTVKKLPKT